MMSCPVYSFPFIRNNAHHQRRWQGHKAKESFHFKNFLAALSIMQKSEGRLIAGRYDGREGLGSDLSPALLTSLRSCKTISGAHKVGVWVVFSFFTFVVLYSQSMHLSKVCNRSMVIWFTPKRKILPLHS